MLTDPRKPKLEKIVEPEEIKVGIAELGGCSWGLWSRGGSVGD